jgi:uncharacterized membrane protein
MVGSFLGDFLEGEKHPSDLIAISIWAAFSVIGILFLPDGSALRWILGLPLLFFLPGYALVSGLWPERGQKIDSGEQASVGMGMDSSERLVLSIGLSLVIAILVGFFLNFAWELTALSVSLSLAIITIAFSIVAVRRRKGVPTSERFYARMRPAMGSSGSEGSQVKTSIDKVIAISLVVCIALIVITAVYIVLTPHEGEGYTEFYILGHDGTVQGIPSNLTVNETAIVVIGMVCHEHQSLNYSIVASAGNATQDTQDGNWTTIHDMAAGRNISITTVLNDEQRMEKEFLFYFSRPGIYKVTWNLYFDGVDQEYELHAWVRVN